MLYRVNNKNNDNISVLGYGCMRLPKKGLKIDLEKTTILIKKAVELGINYFDTAYVYPGSEEALGIILEKEKLRDKIKIATKLPIIMCKKEDDFDKFFNKQLDRLKTDRIDYYLLHMLCDSDTFDKLKLLNIIEWIEKKKKEGSIKNIGFSYHGGKSEFKKLIDSYNWDFCMIQYNYLDEFNQAGKEGLHYAYKKGIPVFVMEPLRGGMLVNGLPEKAKKEFNSIDKKRTLVEWSLRWIWNQKEVTMLLSGMNELKQIEENVQIADRSNIDSLTKKEFDVYDKVLDETNKLTKIPCTGCGYCMPCPQGVDIPTCFSCYNETFTHSYKSGFKRYFMTTGSTSIKQSNASKCIKCKLCEKHCPQNIEISKRLTEVSKRMEFIWFRPITSFVRKIMGIKVK